MSSDFAPARLHLISVARRILEARRRRAQYLPSTILNEIAWEILLSLYAFRRRATPRGVAPAYPRSVTARWIDYLVAEELIERPSGDHEAAAARLTLTEKGALSVEHCLSDFARLIGYRG